MIGVGVPRRNISAGLKRCEESYTFGLSRSPPSGCWQQLEMYRIRLSRWHRPCLGSVLAGVPSRAAWINGQHPPTQ